MTRDELIFAIEKRIGMFLLAADGKSREDWRSLLADAEAGAALRDGRFKCSECWESGGKAIVCEKCLAKLKSDAALGALVRKLPDDKALARYSGGVEPKGWYVVDISWREVHYTEYAQPADTPDEALRMALNIQPCGHPASAIVSGNEGTCFCSECANAKRFDNAHGDGTDGCSRGERC